VQLGAGTMELGTASLLKISATVNLSGAWVQL
jgi:hypothetical protein